MATSVTTAAGRPAAHEVRALTWFAGWVKGHKQAAAYLGIALLLAGVLFVWNLLSTRTAERQAGIRLSEARLAVDSKNFPLAASELAQLVENYSGTRAAQEGTILLAQVRLVQGQNELAVQVLSKFSPAASKAYRAQAYGLLGAAYENMGRPKDAAQAYEQAAAAAQFPFLRAEFLSDAGRTWVAAGDTTQALAAYRAIVSKLDSTGQVTEAKLRIGELTKGAAVR